MTDHALPEKPSRSELLMMTSPAERKEWEECLDAYKRAVKNARDRERRKDPEYREAEYARRRAHYANDAEFREAKKAYHRERWKDPDVREAKKARDREYQARLRQQVIDYMAALPRDTERELLRERWLAPGYRDFNEPMIVNELRRRGYRVDYNPPPEPDLTVRGHGPPFYVEVKAKTKIVSERQRKQFAGLAYPTVQIRTLDDIRELIDTASIEDLAICPE